MKPWVKFPGLNGSWALALGLIVGSPWAWTQEAGVPAAAITGHPESLSVSPGAVATFHVDAGGGAASFQWRKNGREIAGANQATYAIPSVGPGDAGIYSVDVVTSAGTASSRGAILGISTGDAVFGDGYSPESYRNILHKDGNLYNQVLLTGPAVTVTAVPGQMTRVSFIDLNDDIVQVEFSGSGSLTITLDEASGPDLPLLYNQEVPYMRGHASIIVQGAAADTYVSAFSVGRSNAVDTSIFRDDVEYDGWAELARLAVQSAPGEMGGIFFGNASFFDVAGPVGVYAPGVAVSGDVRLHDINAFGEAQPMLVLGGLGDPDSGVRITGGALLQANHLPVHIEGVSELTMIAGSDSHGRIQAAQPLAAELIRDEDEDLRTLIAGNNAFALELYRRLGAADSGNLFFSPNSISTALAMTYAGARGETAREMAAALRFRLPADRLHQAFASMLATLHAERATAGYELRTANRLWPHQDYVFLPEYLRLARARYRAEPQPVDFVFRTEESREIINAWVAEQTADKIKDLLPQGSVNRNTRLVLTNAIYFKGDWASQFDKAATRTEPFHLAPDRQSEVPLMYQKGKFGYAASGDLQVLELPYAGDALSMVIFLPAGPDGLAELERRLDVSSLEAWWDRLHSQEVHVHLPRFQITAKFGLKEMLEQLGMRKAFQGPGADFSGLDGTRELFIGGVFHEAFVDVNEEGTEAAAATGVTIGLTSWVPPTIFRADRPFLFLIRDKRNGNILFLGRVADPQG